MARTINDIQQSIITDLQTYFPKLSTSKVAEWRLWTYVVAAAIHAFEIILDLFRQEVDELTAKITPGTKLWYAEMCYRFQNGHTLVFDKNTAQFYYEQDDPDSRIVKVVAVNEVYKMISIRVAKTDGEGRIIPLDDSERRNLADYIDTIHTTGIPTTIVSTTADTIRYNLEVYYDPAVPSSVVREQVGQALETFKTSLSFDAVFYAQRLVDAVMHAEGVVTVKVVRLEHKIDFRNQARQLLPEHKRQPVRLRILRAFVKPLADLFAAFSLWRDETRKLLNVTNQEGVLEQFLRNKYGAADITIESYRETGFAVGIRSEGVGVAVPVGLNRGEGTPAVVSLRGENREQFGDVDFIVHIPAGVDAEQIRADIEKYRAALTTYKIDQR